MNFDYRSETKSLPIPIELTEDVDLQSKMPLPEIEEEMLSHTADSKQLEFKPNRLNSAAKTCVRIAFAKHIATWSFLSDPEAFLHIQDI